MAFCFVLVVMIFPPPGDDGLTFFSGLKLVDTILISGEDREDLVESILPRHGLTTVWKADLTKLDDFSSHSLLLSLSDEPMLGEDFLGLEMGVVGWRRSPGWPG